MRRFIETVLTLCMGSSLAAQQFESAQVIPPPAESGDPYHNIFFGSAVDVSGNWLAVADYASAYNGEVNLYQWDGSIWRWRQTLREPGNWAYGWSLALEGRTLVVGDPYWGSPRNPRGRVVVYERRGSLWNRQQIIHADGLGDHDSPKFGIALGICSDVMVIGADNTETFVEHAGLIRVFERTGEQWSRVAEFRHRPTPEARSGHSRAFGRAIAVDGQTIVAAAPVRTGSVYVFERIGGSWQFTAELHNPSEIGGDTFGASLAVDGNTIAVGTPVLHDGIFGRQGEVHIYERILGGWAYVATIQASDGFGAPDRGDEFGFSVSVEGNRVLVGADNGNFNGPSTGTAYLFQRQWWGWPMFEDLRFVASDSTGIHGNLGYSVHLEGHTAFVGATQEVVRQARTGKVYLFDLP